MSKLWLLVLIPAALVAAMVVALLVLWLFAVIPWWGLVSGLVVIGFIVLWAAALIDLVRRDDVPLWQIPLWVAAIVLLPVIGALVYLLARPSADQITYRGESTS